MLLIQAATVAQPTFTPFQTAYKRFYFANQDGSLAETVVSYGTWNDGSDQFALLEEALIQQDLGILPEQVDELKELHRLFFSEDARDGRSLANREQWSNQLEDQLKRFNRAVGELFTDDQLHRIREITLQQKLHESSLLANLLKSELGMILNLSTTDRTKLLKLAGSESKRIGVECDSKLSEFKEKLRTLLSEQQQRLLEEYFEQTNELAHFPGLDLFAWQLSVTEQKEFSPELPRNFSRYQYLLAKPVFEVAFDGSLVQRDNTSSRLGNQEVLFNSLRQMLDSESGLVDNVTAYQSAICEELQREQLEMIRELVRVRSQKTDTQEWSTADQDAYNSQVESFVAGAIRDLEQSLSPDQIRQIEYIAERQLVLQFGLPYSLLHGQLGQEIRISKPQKKELLQLCEQLTREYREFSKRQASIHFEHVLRELPQPAAQHLNTILGKPIERRSFAISILGNRLARIGN